MARVGATFEKPNLYIVREGPSSAFYRRIVIRPLRIPPTNKPLRAGRLSITKRSDEAFGPVPSVAELWGSIAGPTRVRRDEIVSSDRDSTTIPAELHRLTSDREHLGIAVGNFAGILV